MGLINKVDMVCLYVLDTIECFRQLRMTPCHFGAPNNQQRM